MLHDKEDFVDKVVAIAGNLQDHGGTGFDVEAKRLKDSDSNSDSQKEGVLLVLKGGKNPLDGPVKERRPQKAVLEFICDHDKTGLEGEWRSEDRYDGDDKKLRRRDDEKEEEGESALEHQLKHDDTALLWEGYKPEGDEDVLRLTWKTKYACEEKRDDDKPDNDDDETSKGSWGFFTWFVIM